MSLLDKIKWNIAHGNQTNYTSKDISKLNYNSPNPEEFSNVLNNVDNPELNDKIKKIPWKFSEVKKLEDPKSILESLTNVEKYTYNTKESKKSFRDMFELLIKVEEEILMEGFMDLN